MAGKIIRSLTVQKEKNWKDGVKYLLVRPDPQVIWDTPKTHRGWKHMNGHYHRSAKGGGEWEFFDLPEQWTIGYKGLTFNLKPFSFKHTGLFPEQAANWDWFGDKIRNAGRPVKVLKSVRLHRRRNPGRCQGRRFRDSRGCLQGHGRLGKRECRILRLQ